MEVRAYVSQASTVGAADGEVRRVLLYREGMLVHEFNGAREVVTAGPRDLDNRGAGATRDHCRCSPGRTGRQPGEHMPSFLAAVAQGADMVELDCRVTKDQRVVVLHDATLER